MWYEMWRYSDSLFMRVRAAPEKNGEIRPRGKGSRISVVISKEEI